MIRKLVVATSLVALSLTTIACTAAESNATWLVGQWTLCQDPDDSPRDTLQFEQDGTGLVLRAAGGTIPFAYTTSGPAVSILATTRGITVPIETTASPDRRKLLFHSDQTGSTSFYVRPDSVAEFACTAE